MKLIGLVFGASAAVVSAWSPGAGLKFAHGTRGAAIAMAGTTDLSAEEPWHATCVASAKPSMDDFVSAAPTPAPPEETEGGKKPAKKETPQGKGWGTYDAPLARAVATTHDNSR